MTNAPKIIRELVEQFETNLRAYKSPTYKEEQLKHDFLNKFFRALGWDVYNDKNAAPQHRDVIFEDSIKIGGGTKAPDYCFTLAGKRMFFVEAKKPSVDIKKDVHPAFQLRRYAWSAKLPLSILTDFEEFAVYEARTRPKKEDKAGTGRVMYLTYKDYIDQWDEIASKFSYDAVVQGYFDRFAETTEKKRGTQEVDSEFLKEIESWRDMLAKNIALRNPEVSIYELNYAVQKIIDRIIFLRICEDRGIEPYGQLQTKAESGGEVYTHLRNHFKLAESKYNSGIFDFDDDRITPTLKIDDKVLKTIIQSLYYPKSPYEFSVLGVEILGNVYEQFLGKVIRLTAGHQAKVETKPEVKKAGGVYYTPQYIVDYIVKNTVGKLIEGKTPEEIAAIKILDPACGSGSFLIGAYTYLLQYHLDWYTTNKPKKHKDAVFQVRENEWYLTTAEKKRILLNNIFGVDIDPQAVEVTKLSLLLKVLEHESRESIDQQVKLGLEGVLPNLAGNIKCGNSLIGPNFYDTQQQATLFDEAEMRRVNVFDWNDDVKGFGAIMKRGGFDCVIGNPPYVRSQLMESAIKNYLSQNYSAAAYQPDTFVFFIQKGIDLLKDKGLIGYIVPNGILTNTYYAKLRRYILTKTALEIVVDLKDGVFEGQSVDTSIFILCREYDSNLLRVHKVKIGECLAKIHKNVITPSNCIEQGIFIEIPDYAFNTKMDAISVDLNRKVFGSSVLLGEYFEVKAGMKVRKDFVTNERMDQRYKRFLIGGDIKPYSLEWSGKYVCYDKKLEKQFTNQAFRDENIFLTSPKLLLRQVMGKDRIHSTVDLEKNYVDQTVYVLILQEKKFDPLYALGLICSRLMTFYFTRTLSDGKQTFPKIKGAQIRQLPIRPIDFSNPEEKAQHDKLVSLVENMLELRKKYHDARMERDKELYERQIKIVDAQIDRLVYELYGLSDEEIKVIEGMGR